MVQLIPNNNNPTMNEIDVYLQHMLFNKRLVEINAVVQEIHAKSGVGALLHPAEKYFLESFVRQKGQR